MVDGTGDFGDSCPSAEARCLKIFILGRECKRGPPLSSCHPATLQHHDCEQLKVSKSQLSRLLGEQCLPPWLTGGTE